MPITTKVVSSKGQDKQRSTKLCTENIRSSNTNPIRDELLCPRINSINIKTRPITSHGRNTSMLTLLHVRATVLYCLSIEDIKEGILKMLLPGLIRLYNCYSLCRNIWYMHEELLSLCFATLSTNTVYCFLNAI